jgi:hypothetical protein
MDIAKPYPISGGTANSNGPVKTTFAVNLIASFIVNPATILSSWEIQSNIIAGLQSDTNELPTAIVSVFPAGPEPPNSTSFGAILTFLFANSGSSIPTTDER